MKACPHCSGTGVLDDSFEAEEAAMRADAKDQRLPLFQNHLVSVAGAARLTGLSEKRLRNLQYEGALKAYNISRGRVCYSILELATLGQR